MQSCLRRGSNVRLRLSLYVIATVAMLFIIGCGSSGGSNNATESNINGTNQPSNQNNEIVQTSQEEQYKQDTPIAYESTPLISGYMAARHMQDISNLEDDETKIDMKLAAQGLYRSGAHIKQYEDNLKNHIQLFVNASLSFAEKTSSSYPIDNTAIVKLFKDYQSIDIAYMNDYTNKHLGVNFSEHVGSTINSLTPEINSIYSIAILQASII